MSLFGGEGETQTLAPVSRPTPLAGAPRHQLEYFSIGSVFTHIHFADFSPPMYYTHLVPECQHFL